MTTLKYGHIVIDPEGVKSKVISVHDDVIVLLEDGFASPNYTEKELRDSGYTWDVPKWTPKIGENF